MSKTVSWWLAAAAVSLAAAAWAQSPTGAEQPAAECECDEQGVCYGCHPWQDAASDGQCAFSFTRVDASAETVDVGDVVLDAQYSVRYQGAEGPVRLDSLELDRSTYPSYGTVYVRSGAQTRLWVLNSSERSAQLAIEACDWQTNLAPGARSLWHVTARDGWFGTIGMITLIGAGFGPFDISLRTLPGDLLEAEVRDAAAGTYYVPDGMTLTAVGADVASTYACVGCHSTDGTRLIGPTFLGLYDSMRRLNDGREVRADEDYLRSELAHPQDQVTAGFAPNGPQNYLESITELQIEAVLAYLTCLGYASSADECEQ